MFEPLVELGEPPSQACDSVAQVESRRAPVPVGRLPGDPTGPPGRGPSRLTRQTTQARRDSPEPKLHRSMSRAMRSGCSDVVM